MLGIGIALLAIALLVSLFGAIWVGVPAGIIGLALIVATLAGVGHSVDRTQERS